MANTEDMRPLSMDDYTDTEFTGQKRKPLVEKLGMVPYGARADAPFMDNVRAGVKKLGAMALGDNDAVMGAFNISREVADNLEFKDNDKTEDTLRHILLGGLVESVQGQAFIAAREEDDEESRIDHNNNLFGKALREKYPDRDSFVQAAISTAVAIGDGNIESIEKLNGLLPMLSLGTSDDVQTMPEEEVATRPDNIVEPDPMKSTDDYTVTQRKGGIMKAREGVMPMTEATANPTGNKPVKGQEIKNPPGRPKNQPESNDPRDIAIAKLKDAIGLKKGAVKIDEELEKGTKDSKGVAVMIGLGAPEIDYSKAEEGDPPPGATKEEVADDQMVLMSEGELVVPANVVRFHGLATYEGMRREALGGLQEMEMDGQISYTDKGNTKKTRQGGIMKAQAGVIPLSSQQYTPTYQQTAVPVVEAASSQFITTPQGAQVYTPSVTQQSLASPVNPQYTPTYTQTPGLATRVVAPNIGYFLPEDQRLSYMRPDDPPSGFVPTPGIPYDPVDPVTPDPVIPTPVTPVTPDPTPDPISEEAEEYIKSGAGQAKLLNVEKALQDSQQSRADIDAAVKSGIFDKDSKNFRPFEGFSAVGADAKDAYSTFTDKEFEGNLNNNIKDMGTAIRTDMAKLFGAPTGLGTKTGVPYSDKTILKNYRDMSIADMPSAFLESIRNPAVAATRKVDAFGKRLYQPGLEDVKGISDATGMSQAAVKKYYGITDESMRYGAYSPVDFVTGKRLSDLTDYEKAARQQRADASERRGERKAKNAQDSGFATQGINSISTEELRAYESINTSLNDGQFDPNGIMGVEQYADFKKTGLNMKSFFKLSRAEQSFYAAARTGDTVQAWVIDSMKQGTTQAFDDMNKTNTTTVLNDDKYAIAGDKQTKPADAKEGYEVNVMQYWQSEEGKKKAKELGVEVG